MGKVRLDIRIDERAKQALVQLATAENRSLTNMIEVLIGRAQHDAKKEAKK